MTKLVCLASVSWVVVPLRHRQLMYSMRKAALLIIAVNVSAKCVLQARPEPHSTMISRFAAMHTEHCGAKPGRYYTKSTCYFGQCSVFRCQLKPAHSIAIGVVQ